MSSLRVLAVLAASSFALTASAASNRVCLGGNLQQLDAAQVHACQQTAQQVQAAADQAGASNWHFVVVCDEAGWQDYAAFATVSADQLQQAAIDNNLQQRTSFVRATRVSGSDNSQLLTSEMVSLARAARTQVAALR